MKKIIALILALCCVFVMAACKKNGEPTPPTTEESVDGVETFKNLFALSAPTKVVTNQTTALESVTLKGSSTLVTGALNDGSAATVYTYSYEILQGIEEGAGEVITPIWTTEEGSREYVEGLGERYDGGTWDENGKNFAPTAGSIVINLDSAKLQNCVYSANGDVKTLSFTVKAKDVASVFGSDASGIKSDVSATISANAAVITGIDISYTIDLVPEDEDLEYPDVLVKISTVYSYGIQEITLVKK